ncbi:hypothetical protein BH10PSE1_BH10PSE1_20230 [soil metagenome]
MFLVPLFLGLVLSGQVVVGPEPEATELGEISVVGARPTMRLTVVVDGDTDATSLVTDEIDLRCGPDRYKYESFGSPRLCWSRRHVGETITLSAVMQGRPAVIDWTGCTEVTAQGACVAVLTTETAIGAHFRPYGG